MIQCFLGYRCKQSAYEQQLYGVSLVTRCKQSAYEQQWLQVSLSYQPAEQALTNSNDTVFPP